MDWNKLALLGQCHNNTFHISLLKLLSHAPYWNYCLCFYCQCELYIAKCKKNVKNGFTILCSFRPYSNSEVKHIVCSVNTSLINNDLFHLMSAYCYDRVTHVCITTHTNEVSMEFPLSYFLIIKLVKKNCKFYCRINLDYCWHRDHWNNKCSMHSRLFISAA